MTNYNEIRRRSKEIRIGKLEIGADNPIAVQSMVNVSGYDAVYAQMRALEDAGCEIIRMTVPDLEAARVLARLKASDITMPIVADIHFDYRMAIEAAMAGADKIRINPGNIGSEDRVKAVVDVCRQRNVPIRVGVNSGSLDKAKLSAFGRATAEALAESALENVQLLEKFDFDKIVVAVKSSSPYTMTEANRIIAERCDYPIHLGVTEAGTLHGGVLKSAAGIGAMLLSGVGDTIRISLTDSPVEEVKQGIALLKALSFYSRPTLDIVSCPTCGRTKIDIISLAAAFETQTVGIKLSKNCKVAIMGCVVNGPGEAGDADFGIAGGIGEAVFFRKGKIVCKIPEDKIIETLLQELEQYK
ncbi:MAG: flavodoxin-dependent (E)-4-hydroxy-3-methylbut-2-enyl-diphosphate synthase [Ruminococcaceae bacterium]|nr:flavodoxin-dependent (E)-4-hydroxy-3-methylbut-2-enyl-diphosphate synthase [Oscillospiraceae bacterium]